MSAEPSEARTPSEVLAAVLGVVVLVTAVVAAGLLAFGIIWRLAEWAVP